MDKKGLAVALTFLVAMFFGARACSDKTTEQVNTVQEQPDLSAEVEFRQAGKIAREAESSGSIESITGVRRELDDPRRPVTP